MTAEIIPFPAKRETLSDRVLRHAQTLAAIRRGDTVETTEGIVHVIDDNLTVWSNGRRFPLQAEHLK